MVQTTKARLVAELATLGYKISERDSFNYRNTFNGKPYDARSCYIVETDTGISFAHYRDARRDEKFERLQAMRLEEYVIKGRIYEL